MLLVSRKQAAHDCLLAVKDESAKLDLQMLHSTLDHNKKVLQVMQEYRNTVAGKADCTGDQVASKLPPNNTSQKTVLEGA